jgi:hypothetical protein
MNREESGKKIGQIIAKAWADEGFKQRLLKGADTVLRDEGVDIPQGLEVRVVENTDKMFHIVLPPEPTRGALSFEQLAQAVGADCCGPAQEGGRCCGPAKE